MNQLVVPILPPNYNGGNGPDYNSYDYNTNNIDQGEYDTQNRPESQNTSPNFGYMVQKW